MNDFVFFTITSMPNAGLDKPIFMEVMGKHDFALVYDFANKTTLLGIEEEKSVEFSKMIADVVPGFSIAQSKFKPQMTSAEIFCCYRQQTEGNPISLFSDIFSLDFDTGFLCIAFLHTSSSEIEKSKRRIEGLLSSKGLKETATGTKGPFNSKTSISIQRDLFDASEERLLLEQMLNSLNNSLLSNGMAYKVFVMSGADESISDYLSSRALVLMDYGIKSPATFMQLVDHVKKLEALPVGCDIACGFLNFYGPYRLGYALRTHLPHSSGNLAIGNFLKDGTSASEITISIATASLNLGFIVTGLPGSGKTMESMELIRSILTTANNGAKTAVFVISPTNEWNDFASQNGMYQITIGDGTIPINFFMCPDSVERRVFYEDLAMILSSASNAGPYQNPMEKCMLNAFRAIYKGTASPDPISAYNEIENSIIKLHAKRTNVGVKYTKHGENIRSALENLRAILSMPEYSVVRGIKMGDMTQNGIVFDLSKVSSGSKAYMYALILNQIYALASCLDLNGDNELRMLICIEEAQLIFGSRDSAALQDIKQRIQDFRKQGVGIMLLTHNVTDIDSSLRRLCQTKLYLKQAPDVAPIAAKDMVFSHAKEEEVVLKLKLLDSRAGAFTYVTKSGGQNLPNDTVFVSTKTYIGNKRLKAPSIADYMKERSLSVPSIIKSNISIRCYSEEDAKSLSVITGLKLTYLNETVFECGIEKGYNVAELLEGKAYNLQLLSTKGKIITNINVVAKPEIIIELSNGRISQIGQAP